jgi:hypothetical protein
MHSRHQHGHWSPRINSNAAPQMSENGKVARKVVWLGNIPTGVTEHELREFLLGKKYMVRKHLVAFSQSPIC